MYLFNTGMGRAEEMILQNFYWTRIIKAVRKKVKNMTLANL